MHEMTNFWGLLHSQTYPEYGSSSYKVDRFLQTSLEDGQIKPIFKHQDDSCPTIYIHIIVSLSWFLH